MDPDPTTDPVWATNDNNVITSIVESLISGEELWKSDGGGDLSNSYVSGLTDSGGTISHVTGTPTIGAPAYMLVKDGNHTPWWYLFDLTDMGWVGEEVLELSGFWDGGGAISHVSLYGSSVPVPEPVTILLFGSGLLGLAGVSRKFRKKRGILTKASQV